MTDREGKIKFASQVACRLLGTYVREGQKRVGMFRDDFQGNMNLEAACAAEKLGCAVCAVAYLRCRGRRDEYILGRCKCAHSHVPRDGVERRVVLTNLSGSYNVFCACGWGRLRTLDFVVCVIGSASLHVRVFLLSTRIHTSSTFHLNLDVVNHSEVMVILLVLWYLLYTQPG